MHTDAFHTVLERPVLGIVQVWLRLLRFPFHLSYVTVILGAATARRGIDWSLVLQLAALYPLFNIILYGGLYTLNAITDASSDRAHPGKRERPLASGAISNRAASYLALAHAGVAFVLAASFYGVDMTIYFSAFTLINLAYSLGGRQVAYLEITLNALTYPFRFAMGAWLAGGAATAGALAIVFLTAFGVASTRRYVEKATPGWEARRGMRRYSPAILRTLRCAPLAALLLMCLLDRSSPPVYYAVAIPSYLVLVYGLDLSGSLRRAFVRLWTR